MEPNPHRISSKCFWDDEEHIAYSILYTITPYSIQHIVQHAIIVHQAHGLSIRANERTSISRLQLIERDPSLAGQSAPTRQSIQPKLSG